MPNQTTSVAWRSCKGYYTNSYIKVFHLAADTESLSQNLAASSTKSLYSSETKDFTLMPGFPSAFPGDSYFIPITVVKPVTKYKPLINLLHDRTSNQDIFLGGISSYSN